MTAAERALRTMPRVVYERSAVVAAVLGAVGPEFDDLRETIEAIGGARAVATADAWGLELLEAEAGLPAMPDSSDADRRARLLAAGWRASGTATPARIQELAAAWSFGSVDIAETIASYLVTLTFADPQGEPPDLAALQRAMRRVIPAHLAIEYAFTWFTWADLRAETWTWADVRALGLTWAELAVLTEAESMPFKSSKTITFTGAAGLGAVGNVPLFNAPTGKVVLQAIAIKCTSDLVSAGAGSLEVLVSGVSAAGPNIPASLLAATPATTIDTGEFHLANPAVNAVMDSAGAGIYGTVTVGAITGGTLVVDLYYQKLTNDGALTPAA